MHKIRVGTIVKIISGSFSGNEGKIIKINRRKNLVYLEEYFRERFVKNRNWNLKEYKSGNESISKRKVYIPIDISNIKIKNDSNSTKKREND